ncbi:MAG TPA: SpoIIE family protein phosphatase [Anaerolineae bacterium]|nr:SpoIIE family protein phosphatase [Anaerolineae bacterium]HMR63766.1 SpoIIE family protein phosphatase [Anaerolineae bacterium]
MNYSIIMNMRVQDFGPRLIRSLRMGQFVGLNFGLVLLLAILIGLAGRAAYQISLQQNEVIQTRNRVERLTLRMQILTLERTDLLRRYLESGNRRQRLLYQSKHGEYETVYNELAFLLRNTNEARALQVVLETEDAFDGAVQEAFDLYDSGSPAEAQQFWETEGWVLQRNIIEATNRWIEVQDQQNEAIITQARRTESWAIWSVSLFSGLILLGGLLSSIVVTRSVTKPISNLVNKIKTVDFDLTTRVNASGPAEIAFLGQSFNAMAERLLQSKHELEAERDRFERELTAASQTQISFFPQFDPQIPYLDVACYWQPARELAGDFYTYMQLDQNRFGVVLGDVVGKGAAAAMTGSLTLGLTEAHLPDYHHPVELLTKLNNILCHRFRTDQAAVACCYAIFEASTRLMIVANAGSMFPYLRRRYTINEIEIGGLPVGLWPEAEYGAKCVPLQPGDLIVFSSDGLVEAKNLSGEFFGLDRFAAELRQVPDQASARQVIEHLTSALNAFAGPAHLSDDVTLIAIRVSS